MPDPSGHRVWYAVAWRLLPPSRSAAELAATPGWTVSDGQLTRTVTRKDFRDALLFVNAVGFLAERANHHPDIPSPGTR